MKFFIKKIYTILFLAIVLLSESQVLAKNNDKKYTQKNISNYFLGIFSTNIDRNDKAFKYLKKMQSIKNIHSEYNIEFVRTLILLEKFDDAFAFSEKVWDENELFFEADLLLGLKYFIKEDYANAEKYFQRLNKISRYNLVFNNFVGNILTSWVKAQQSDRDGSYKILENIPNSYYHLTKTQKTFLQCYFNSNETEKSFKEIIENKEYDLTRYNFFLINYYLSKNENIKAKALLESSRKKYNSNLLIKQAEIFFLNDQTKKISNFFDCKNPKDALAEFFYIISNLYSNEENYRLSNFYLKISLFLNKNFLANKALLAENFFYQKKYDESKKIYNSLKKVGIAYSWYAAKSIASILLNEKSVDFSIKSLEKEFNELPVHTFENYYEIANFYKDNEYFEESIKYYSLALNKIEKNHSLVPKILDRRGTSYERIGDWKNAEKDLMKSLQILPDQAHVLNYLAYTWVDKGINLDKGLEMLKKASDLKKNDGYIIDSLGWAYYAKKNYVEANIFLQQAVTLLPSDPIINDHYGDVLWMLDKNIQARHIWSSILELSKTEDKLKSNIRKKLIFGLEKKL